MLFPQNTRNRIIAASCAMLASGAGAADFQAYDPDAHTLHLWSMDQTQPPFEDRGGKALALEGLLNGALAAQPSLPGFGHSIRFVENRGGTPGKSDLAGAILLAKSQLATGNEDNAPADFKYFGDGGAFTYEMIVRFEVLPGDSPTIASCLLSMDGDGNDRIFNFRIEKEGFLSFIPLSHGGCSGLGLATIPTTGTHAINTEDWFHVAVSYDGNPGTPNNLKLYWTKILPGLKAANRIGSGTLSSGFNGNVGDFAIGNEARSFEGNAEAEPFPGWIDEVRISGVARHPTDFFFVPPALRVSPEAAMEAAAKPVDAADFELQLAGVLVDASSAMVPADLGKGLQLGPGLHRLDFDFGLGPEHSDGSAKIRCQLEGIDDRWIETELGMTLICEALDQETRVLSQSRFPFMGRSTGWETTLEDSSLTNRVEPMFVPGETAALRITISSGSADTTGFIAIDGLSLMVPGTGGMSLWKQGSLAYDDKTDRAAGAPAGWLRGGSDPAIARLVFKPENPLLGLVDGDQRRHGEWTSIQPIQMPGQRGGTCILSWQEAYNIIGGSLHRATYVNVPAGRYTFRAIGITGDNEPIGHSIALPITIAPPFWGQPWFWPALASSFVGLIATAVFVGHRRRSKRRVELLRFQNALEKDRTRIARDLHDDLGTRVTLINMTASLAKRDMEKDPEKARRHLEKMSDSARGLVVAMDDLVWAVDPAHDTLDHLASHLTRLSEELFRDSPVRCRLDIPSLLPPRPLGADFRHHIALAVKESLHNVLQHAGPCEVFLKLAFNGEKITITIRDTGKGFDSSDPSSGHGLGNTVARIGEIGGECSINSSPGGGTSVEMICLLPHNPS